MSMKQIPIPSEGWYIAMSKKKTEVIFAESHDEVGTVIWPQDGSLPYEWPDHQFTSLHKFDLPHSALAVLADPTTD